MLVKYINRMESSASLQKGGVPEKGPSQALKSSRASLSLTSRSTVSHVVPGLHNMTSGPGAQEFNKQNDKALIRKNWIRLNQKEKGIIFPSNYDHKRATGMNNRKILTSITLDFKSHLRQLIALVKGEQRVVQSNNLTYAKDKIKEITEEIFDPKIVVAKYSWSENGRYGKGSDFMESQSIQMLQRIEKYVEALIDNNNTSQEMYYITLALFDFASDVLSLYIPKDVKTMFEKLLPLITKWRSDNAALNAQNNAVELEKYLNYNRQIYEISQKSLAHHQEIERLESEMLTARLTRSKQGGKSMKPKQHRNSKTQKKRQRKNQKK